MAESKDNLYLYQALELRGEYQARLDSLKALLPEQRKLQRGIWDRETNNEYKEPAAGFDPAEIREQIRRLEYKSRRLNTAIQQANFANDVLVNNEKMSIAEALEIRKAVNQELAGLQKMLERSAYRTVIYKEERNITQEPEDNFQEVYNRLEEKRMLFRELNRALRKASFTVTIQFKDEA